MTAGADGPIPARRTAALAWATVVGLVLQLVLLCPNCPGLAFEGVPLLRCAGPPVRCASPAGPNAGGAARPSAPRAASPGRDCGSTCASACRPRASTCASTSCAAPATVPATPDPDVAPGDADPASPGPCTPERCMVMCLDYALEQRGITARAVGGDDPDQAPFDLHAALPRVLLPALLAPDVGHLCPAIRGSPFGAPLGAKASCALQALLCVWRN